MFSGGLEGSGDWGWHIGPTIVVRIVNQVPIVHHLRLFILKKIRCGVSRLELGSRAFLPLEMVLNTVA